MVGCGSDGSAVGNSTDQDELKAFVEANPQYAEEPSVATSQLNPPSKDENNKRPEEDEIRTDTLSLEN